MIASDAFGVLTAELRRAEANHHDIESLLPRRIRARSLNDADDIAAVLHERLARATARPTGSGRARKPARLIAGLIPEATGRMTLDMRQALTERRDLIEARADVLLDQALTKGEPWTTALGTPPATTKPATNWRRHGRTIAAYRDRYAITALIPLGEPSENAAQKIDAARAQAAYTGARALTETPDRMQELGRPAARARTGRSI